MLQEKKIHSRHLDTTVFYSELKVPSPLTQFTAKKLCAFLFTFSLRFIVRFITIIHAAVLNFFNNEYEDDSIFKYNEIFQTVAH